MLTWVVIGIIVVVILGIGIQAFMGGLFQGAKKISENPVIQNATSEGVNALKDKVTEEVTNAVK